MMLNSIGASGWDRSIVQFSFGSARIVSGSRASASM